VIYRRSFPFVSGKFVPTCAVSKRIKRGNYVHLNNNEVSKVFLHSRFLVFTCAKSVIIFYGTFTLIYAKHFWDRTLWTLFYLTTGSSHFWWTRLAYKTFLMYNKRDSLSRKITVPSWNVVNKNLISTAILLNWNAWTPTHGKLELQRALHFLLSRETVCTKSGADCSMQWCTVRVKGWSI